MTPLRPVPPILFPLAAIAAALVLSACDGAPAAPPPPPPMGVEVLTLEPKPLARTTEYVGTIRSRRSSTVEPQVEGLVTRIHVRSGERVAAGDLILEIDPSRQRAAVASLESIRAAREADLAYAQIEAERQRTLVEAGAASRRELEIAETALRTTEAQLHAIEEQIREQQVELDYFRVTAPVAGIVGDIPVRVGDRVAPGVALTSIDATGALELYVHVPVEQSGALRLGLPVEVVDDAGEPIATTAIAFVSPQIDERTQSILAKAPITDEAGFRTEQLVRARIVWSNDPGLTVPVTAVSRINGAYFAFVAESGPEGVVARQRRLRLGEIIGNDYVLIEGLAAGDRLIVSGVQKVHDGAPVDTGEQG